MQCPQRIALPAGLVLGEREQRPALLAQRRLGNPRLRLGQHLTVAPGLEGGIDAKFLGMEAQFLQTCRLGAAVLPPLQFGERLAPPQRKRLVDDVEGPIGLAEREQLLGPVHQALEAVGVELLSRQRQPVAQTAGLDGIGAEHLAQPHHATLDHLRPRGRRQLPSPQRIGQHVGAHHLAPTNGQHPEHDPLSRCQSGAIAVDRHRAENGDGHPGEHSQDCRSLSTAYLPR